MKRLPTRVFSPNSRGFALVVTLSLMILLTIVAVGLLGLSAVSLRSASAEMLMREARQNARLALMLAIGDLQTTTGPDQRVTAPGQVLGADVAQPHLTGVWQGWKWDGKGDPEFEDRKKSGFLRWLASTREVGGGNGVDFVKSAPAGGIAALVRGNRDPAENDLVNAQIVPVSSSARNTSAGFAWAVFDESTKLPTALPEPSGQSITKSMIRMAAAPLPGYAAATVRDWNPLGLLADSRTKLISAGQVGLVDVAEADRGFHDVTSRSSGIAADVAEGGLSVDLSRMFSNPTTLPADYANRHLYSGTDTPLVPAPNRFQGANPFPSPDPSWRLLHSHYRLYDKITGGLNKPTLATTTTARPPAGTTGTLAEEHPFFHAQQIAPVIAKAQFVFSLSFGWHSTLTANSKDGNDALPDSNPTKDHFVTWLVVDPVITLWNPYNVNLRFTGGRIDLYRVPLTFQLYKNGQKISSEYTHLANCFLSGTSFEARKNTFYRLNLLPAAGSSEIILAPGEHKVLTASNHVKNFNNEFSNVGMNLRPGFQPPAGNSSNSAVGGVSTVSVCVSSTGVSNGRQYGKNVRTVAVKPGDVLQIEVKPGRAAVDTPAETGGREVSGFLKYYIGPPSAQRLVGGIELDYGSDEGAYLPSFPQQDLPSIVVSNAIPKKVKADDYQGSSPPVVVRFKEPFLISTFQLKTERDSKFPSRGWLDNSPVNLFASEGIDQKEPWSAQQFELQWEAMTDWSSSPTVEIANNTDRGYGGSGIFAQSGVEFATHCGVPLAPAHSLAQFRHAPLNTGGQLPLTSQIVANSFAPPLLDPTAIRSTAGNRTFLDHSYHANAAIFDQYFLSSLADPGGPLEPGESVRDAITGLFVNGKALPNPRFTPYHGGKTVAEIADALTAPDGHLKSAAHLLIDSPLNVNCSRVDVWEAFLSSTFGADVPRIENGKVGTISGENTGVARHLPSNGSAFETNADALGQDLAKWNGHRRLLPGQIRRLAEEIVKEIRTRGPFQSLAEFVNRRPGTGDLAKNGALQAAIERAGINEPTLDPALVTAHGNTADGAPGVLTQADILTPIAPVLTARGDTFRIRAYGEAGPANGPKVMAWCEAVVQRIPDYIDPADEAWSQPTRIANQRFGRRYELLAFRWLSPSEV
jgi:hypothetical protein